MTRTLTRTIVTASRLLTGSFTPFLIPFWGEEERAVVRQWLGGASYPDAVGRLEEAIVSPLGSAWTVRTANSGRAAIQLALESMRLPPGSEVIMPTFVCAAVAMPVIQAGMRPVLVDVDRDFNISFSSVLAADAPGVKAIIVPHLSGCWAADTERIIEWARSRNVFVIENCAQSFGLQYKGQHVGTFGDVGIFSSGQGKVLFGPSGGWAISRHPHLVSGLRSRHIPVEPQWERVAHRIRRFVERYAASSGRQGRALFRDVAAEKLANILREKTSGADFDPYRFSVYTMSDIEAQLVLLQLQKADAIIRKRHTFANRWRTLLSEFGFDMVRLLPETQNVHTKMLLSFPWETRGALSKTLRWILWSQGIETEPSYTPLHLRASFAAFRRTPMPITEQQWKGAFAVPVRPNLHSGDWERIEQGVSCAAMGMRSAVECDPNV